MANASYLQEVLWDSAEEGENYNCTEEQIAQFIGEVFVSRPSAVRVHDSKTGGWVKLFKLWLTQQ